MQQPYEISVLLENPHIGLAIQVYPNPTTHSLTLQLGNLNLSNLNFQLFDFSGKLIESKKTNPAKSIQMENLSSAIYFLKVLCCAKELLVQMSLYWFCQLNCVKKHVGVS